MEQEKTSGKVLFESLSEQFRLIVPKKALRVLLVAVTAVLLLGVLVGIVSGSLAIARCGTSRSVEAGEAKPAAAVQAEKPSRPEPGLSSDTVMVKKPTEAPPTEIPTAAPEITPAPMETPAPEETAAVGEDTQESDTT